MDAHHESGGSTGTWAALSEGRGVMNVNAACTTRHIGQITRAWSRLRVRSTALGLGKGKIPVFGGGGGAARRARTWRLGRLERSFW